MNVIEMNNKRNRLLIIEKDHILKKDIEMVKIDKAKSGLKFLGKEIIIDDGSTLERFQVDIPMELHKQLNELQKQSGYRKREFWAEILKAMVDEFS